MKRILAIPIFILFIVSGLLSQGNKPHVSKNNAPWIGVSFSPDLGFRRLQNTKGTEYLDDVIRFRDSLETPRWGYTTGLCVQFPLNHSWAIETGIQYSNTRFMRIQSTNDLTPDTGQLLRQTSFFNYHYVNFPFKVRWMSGSKKMRFTTVAGISANTFIKDTQCHTYDYQNKESIEKKGVTGFKYHQFAIVPSLGVGILYMINDKMMLTMEPTFRYDLTQTVKEPITNYLYNAGLNMSIYIR